ncbi:DUF2267 domain-containing protein [Haloactinomyces albus]|uniref:Uncharacterized protein (DUF2267 family) n=1 Tax=Haloactinomyces albus TaxID=1352928 RepID=A0AAE3Z9W1_9ACTN|nr:DUF2267 domain-containing protein [Haloactinomyces albus]MDR7299975.1 uncharacterized protein (DUF2267 family) [Haloactinomyces albus]
MDSFLDRVAERAGLSTRQEADRLARATMSALSERITAGQINDLSPGLPPELGTELAGHTGQAVAFDKSTFLDRISGEIETVDLDEAERQIRVVFAVLREWVPDEEIDDTLGQLSPELADMFRPS